tara:strand:+ start:462 stop:1277 length:816 start_codon:yes stop_codon:yes gene_type:complete
MAAIQTNISLTKIQKEYFQRFVNLSINEEALPQGDATMRISPFDDYFLFTVFDEIDNEDTPIDLSNVGNIYISFIGTNDEIVVKNHTQVEEADLSQGEVLFRITKSDSKKILALNNNNFYISTKMVSTEDDSISDESILYQGTWLAFDAASKLTLTSQIEEQRLEYSIELAKLKDKNAVLIASNDELLKLTGENTLVIQALQASNDEMVNEIAELNKDLSSTESAEINRKAAAAAALARKQLLEMQQRKSFASSSPTFFEVASANLQKFSI